MSDAIEQQPGPGEKKVSRPTKPSFSEFIAALNAIVAQPANTGLPQLRKTLARGFADKEEQPLFAQTTAILRTCSWADRWAVQAAVTDTAGRLKKLHQHLLTELRNDFAREIGFFQLQHDSIPSGQELERWIAQSLSERKQRNHGTTPPTSDDAWARRVFICLLGRTTPDKRSHAILTFIEFWAGQAKRHTKEPQLEAEWYRFLGTVMTADQLKRARITPIVGALYLIKAQLTTALNRELSLRREVDDKQEAIADLTKAAGELRDCLATAETTSNERAARITALEQQLREAAERYQLLDEHWKRSSTTTTARKVGSLSQEMGHEVDETMLSLDQPTPNVPMALNRLRRLQAIIKRQTGNRED